MNAMNSVDVLNRLVVIHHRSLPIYLSYASPTWHRGDERAQEVLRTIAADQQQLVDRFGEMILEADGYVQFGGFPMRFTDYHDLSFDFLRTRLLELQRQNIATIEDCVERLAADAVAQSLAQEALVSARRHLALLEELKPESSSVKV